MDRAFNQAGQHNMRGNSQQRTAAHPDDERPVRFVGFTGDAGQILKSRWWWVLAALPTVAGVISIAAGTGDLRTSGLVLGVSLSIGISAIILLSRAPWRNRTGIARWVAPVPALLLGLVGLAGLLQGLPEFLQARGLFIDVDSVGPVAVVEADGLLVMVGNDTSGGFVWTSPDGTTWTEADESNARDLEMADLVGLESGVALLAQSPDAEGVILVLEDGGTFTETARFANSDHGTIPQAVASLLDGLVVVSDIYGNDVEFHVSDDARVFITAQPAATFDDGESARDIACGEQVCIGVGFHDATYRSYLEINTGVAWIGSGSEYEFVNHDFGAERACIPWCGTRPDSLSSAQIRMAAR